MDKNTTETFTVHVIRGGNRVTIATPRGTATAELIRCDAGPHVDRASVSMPSTIPTAWRALIEDLATETGSVLASIDGAGLYEFEAKPGTRMIPIPVTVKTDRYGASTVDLTYHGNIGTWVYPDQDAMWVSRPAWAAAFANEGANGLRLAMALSRCADTARHFVITEGFVYLTARIVGHCDIEFAVTVPG